MKNLFKPVSITLLLLISVASHAAEEQYENLRKMISLTFPGVEITAFKESSVPSFVEFNLGAQVLYVSKDGRFLFQGDIYDLVKQENITEKAKQVSRVAVLESLGEKNMLVYEPKKREHFITVFTDIDCPYCRRLHEEVGKYLENNIAVRYMFLPFKGKKSLEKSVSVWCAKDQQAAMDEAKHGRDVPVAICDNPIKQHMEIGQDLGIRGTPAIVLDNGTMIPGYRPVADVVKMLNK